MHNISFLVTLAVLLTVSLSPIAKCDGTTETSSQRQPSILNLKPKNDHDFLYEDDYVSTEKPKPREYTSQEVAELDEENSDSVYILGNTDWLSAEQERKMLFYSPNKSLGHDCCPSTYELTSPTFGRNLRGEMVKLYSSETLHQQFVEISCKEDVINNKCRFMHKIYSNRSRCVQKYSFAYALIAVGNETLETPVKTNNTSEYSEHTTPAVRTNLYSDTADVYKLDHIQIRSGCSCVIEPKKPVDKPTGSAKKIKKVRKITKVKKRATKAPES